MVTHAPPTKEARDWSMQNSWYWGMGGRNDGVGTGEGTQADVGNCPYSALGWMTDSQNSFYFSRLISLQESEHWASVDCGAGPGGPGTVALPSHGWSCVWNKSANPQTDRRRVCCLSCWLISLLPGLQKSLPAQGKKKEKYQIVLYGWGTVHKQFKAYDETESLREKKIQRLCCLHHFGTVQRFFTEHKMFEAEQLSWC